MLGQADAATNYSEFLRQSFIAGPFHGADAAAPPRYYIGKYEVTRDQYSAVTSETCPTPATAGRLPQADIAWHDAIGFTLRYSTWLARNARDALPTRDDARVRLARPTPRCATRVRCSSVVRSMHSVAFDASSVGFSMVSPPRNAFTARGPYIMGREGD